jgi:hypothetical protein
MPHSRDKSSRRFRLHYLSWLVLMVMSACMAVIIIPGTADSSIEYERRRLHDMHGISPPYWSEYDYIRVSVWTHGWPLEYLRRPFEQSTYLIGNEGLPVAWTSFAAWPQSGKHYYFNLSRLALDLLVGLAITAIAVAACEFWRRRRGGFRVSILDFGVLATILCAILGCRQLHVHAGEREREMVGNIEGFQVGHISYGGGWQGKAVQYCGPGWLQRLVGNSEFLPAFHHITGLNIDLRKSTGQEKYGDLSDLAYVRSVECRAKLTPKLAKSLSSLPRLETLQEYSGGYSGKDPRAEPMLTPGHLDPIQMLPLLTTLKAVQFRSTPHDLEVLATLQNLQTLQFNGKNLLVEDLTLLERFPSLKTVQLNISATNEEMEEFQATHPRFRLVWDEEQCLDPWNAMQARLARWRGEVELPRPHSVGFGGRSAEDRDHLDLTGFLLTKERLTRLPKDLSEINSVFFGDVDTPATAVELLSRCGPIQSLNARRVTLSKQDFDQINFRANKRRDLDLSLQQGDMSVEDFCWLAKKLKLSSLIIVESTFKLEEAEAIEEASPDIFLELYRGMEEVEDELIYPIYSNDAEEFSF